MERHWNNVADRVKQVFEEIEESCAKCGRNAKEIQVMAVTKTVPPEIVNLAVDAGIHLLGENRSQELNTKYEFYKKENCDIHFIGSLQSNKVRQVIDKVTMIQSVDRLPLAKEIQHQCELFHKSMEILIEVNIGKEESKGGIYAEDLERFLWQIRQFSLLKVRGLMAIPPFSKAEEEKEKYFSAMNQIFIDIKSKNIDNVNMDFLSMGMSMDYPYAIKHGSNLIRLGQAIFGARV